MSEAKIRYSRVLEDDASPLDQAIASGTGKPLVLWGHPEIGQSAVLEAAAGAAKRRLHVVEPEELRSWEGLKDVTASGHFRAISLEKFLEQGERADPVTFAAEPGEVLHLAALNTVPSKLVGPVVDGILDEGRLLNNLLPEGVRIVATAWPHDRQAALDLLGPQLREVWNGTRGRSDFRYGVHALPRRLIESAEHWALRPSVARFVAWARRRTLAEEVVGYLEDLQRNDPAVALARLHAALLHQSDPFPQIASPRAFAELGALLSERRLYFSSRAVRLALARSSSTEAFLDWLHKHMAGWDPERWIHADAILTLRGEPAPGSAWLRHLCESVRGGSARVSMEDLPTYATFERGSLAMWVTQELGDEVGAEFLEAIAIAPEAFRRLA